MKVVKQIIASKYSWQNHQVKMLLASREFNKVAWVVTRKVLSTKEICRLLTRNQSKLNLFVEGIWFRVQKCLLKFNTLMSNVLILFLFCFVKGHHIYLIIVIFLHFFSHKFISFQTVDYDPSFWLNKYSSIYHVILLSRKIAISSKAIIVKLVIYKPRKNWFQKYFRPEIQCQLKSTLISIAWQWSSW